MSGALLSCVCLLALFATVCFAATVDSDFTTFLSLVKKYDRKYDSPAELQKRFNIFQQNAQTIQQYRNQHVRENSESGDAVYGHTKFFDMSSAEFKAQYLNYKPAPSQYRNAPVHNARYISDDVTSVDWRQKGCITPVKDQQQCGSCWAFSATEGMESFWNLAGNDLVELAVQQIVSCDHVDQGCNGGDLPTAFAYIEKAGGLELDSKYPYTSGGGNNGVCLFDKSDIVAHMSNFTYATKPCLDACNSQNETELAANLAVVGPSSICLNAQPWQFYTGGVLKSGCSHSYSDLDHCVQLVGYDTTGETPYWIVRNSWNTDWGIEGYIYLEMYKNVCGVADEATFVVI